MTLHIQLLPPSFFACGLSARHSGKLTSGKVLPVPEKHYFFNFRRTDFPKAPLRGFKSTPFTCLRPFSAPWVSAREWRRLRRLVKTVLLRLPIPGLAIGAPTIEFIRFQFDFIIFNRILTPVQGKHSSGRKINRAVRVLPANHPLLASSPVGPIRDISNWAWGSICSRT